jgi:hypothetical protein
MPAAANKRVEGKRIKGLKDQWTKGAEKNALADREIQE